MFFLENEQQIVGKGNEGESQNPHQTLVITNIAKPMLCHSPEFYHCLFIFNQELKSTNMFELFYFKFQKRSKSTSVCLSLWLWVHLSLCPFLVCLKEIKKNCLRYHNYNHPLRKPELVRKI